MIQKNITNVGLLTLAMLCFSTGVETLISGGMEEAVISLVEIGVGILFLVVREVCKKLGDEI